jgi:hypothetical protein
MTTPSESFRSKVAALFAEMAGGRALRLNGMNVIESALQVEVGAEKAHEIAFHLSDWSDDAAFILALHLFPERFTPEEVSQGVLEFLIHVPNHVAAAAHLYGLPIGDVFGVGLELDK